MAMVFVYDVCRSAPHGKVDSVTRDGLEIAKERDRGDVSIDI